MNSICHSNNSHYPKVEVVKIIPAISQDELFEHRHCYLGVSLANRLFEKPYLPALLEWIAAHFESCLVIIGDHLCRYNERIFRGLDTPQAGDAALEMGRQYIKNNRHFFEQYPNDKFQLTGWREHLNSEQFKEANQRLKKLFETNEEFRKAVEKDAFGYINRKSKHGLTPAVDTEEAAELSCEYLIEEIAVFSVVSQQGWQVEIYPGPELALLEEIATGKYADLPAGLEKRINVELKIHPYKRQH